MGACLFQNENSFLRANVLEDLGPHRDADFAQVRFAEQKHQGSRLSDAASNRQRDFVLQYGAMVGQTQEVSLLA